MKIHKVIACIAIAFGSAFSATAQKEDRDRVPLMTMAEEKIVNAQSDEFNKALEDVVSEASKSTVRIWGDTRKPRILAYGTVVGNGSQVLTKWSEIERYVDSLQIQANGRESYQATVAGVYSDEDLVLLDLGYGREVRESGEISTKAAAPLVPAKFFKSDFPLGRFITASQPSGKPAAFGVVSVLERNLRETDQAHLGIMADDKYRGEGVRIANVQPEYGAAEAGLRAGDVILKVDDRKVSGLQELKNALTMKQPGDTVTLMLEAAGKERSIGVRLSNRPVIGQFSGDRLNQMERMGGTTSVVRGGFSRVIQSDMRINSNQIGGPVVDLEGRVVGITVARADRTRTYIMGSESVLVLLKTKSDTVAEARAKQTAEQQMLAKQQQEFLPKLRAAGKPRDVERMRRHLSDMERLMGRMQEEMEALEQP
jgi:serine protease Do